MKFIYPAVFRKTENGYHAFFPDLECCEASGDTLDDAIENANEACRNAARLPATLWTTLSKMQMRRAGTGSQ